MAISPDYCVGNYTGVDGGEGINSLMEPNPAHRDVPYIPVVNATVMVSKRCIPDEEDAPSGSALDLGIPWRTLPRRPRANGRLPLPSAKIRKGPPFRQRRPSRYQVRPFVTSGTPQGRPEVWPSRVAFHSSDADKVVVTKD